MAESTACGNCGETLTEPASTPVEKRQPCPKCGSTRRNFSVELTASVTASASVTATVVTYPNALLTIAQSLINQGHFNIAIVTSHMACEVAAERAFDAEYAAKNLQRAHWYGTREAVVLAAVQKRFREAELYSPQGRAREQSRSGGCLAGGQRGGNVSQADVRSTGAKDRGNATTNSSPLQLIGGNWIPGTQF